MTSTGTFILSLDTEIAWGTYANLEARADSFDKFPRILRRIMRQLNIYEISATWAIVGHLLLDEGEATPVPQPHYSFADANDRERLANRPAGWSYAPYLVERLQSMRVQQDIGSHTFTHVLATDEGVTRDLFDAQLAEVVRVHKARGLDAPTSFVYPQNRVAYTDLLKKHGFTSYRGVAADWYTWFPSPLRRPAHLIDRTLALTPPTYRFDRRLTGEGLVNLPASQFLMSYDGIRSKIPTSSRVDQAKRGIQRAIERGEIYHLWFHPFNMGSHFVMCDAFTQILTHVWELRDEGKLRVMSMAQAADEILISQQPQAMAT